VTEPVPAMRGVDRALRLITVLGGRGSGYTLDELSRVLDLPKSSLHRILAVFRANGYATQPEPGGRYFLGPAALEAAFRFHESMDLRMLVHQLILQIRDRFDETAHMAVMDGSDVVYLDKVEASHSVRLTSVIGGRNPAHATGVGKAMLAFTLADEAQVRSWIALHGPLVARTENTVVTVDAFAARLDTVRRRGFSLDDEESELGVRCVAVPVFFGSKVPVAAVSVTAPKDRLRIGDAETLGRSLRDMVAVYEKNG